MRAVKFLRPHQMYQPGETAGFDDGVAASLINSGIAFDPRKPAAGMQATEDLLVNPEAQTGEAEVELKTRVQSFVEPSGKPHAVKSKPAARVTTKKG